MVDAQVPGDFQLTEDEFKDLTESVQAFDGVMKCGFVMPGFASSRSFQRVEAPRNFWAMDSRVSPTWTL